MALADLTEPSAVLKAIEEADTLGRQTFLDKYGFSPSREYFIRHEGRLYDSKAIIGAAHGYQHPDRGPLRSTDFSGGEQTVQRKLEQLGFAVEVEATSPEPEGRFSPAQRNDPEAARRLMESLYPDPRDREKAANRLVRSIEYAESQRPGCWSVTAFRDRIRLNVGRIAVLDLWSDVVNIVLPAETVTPALRAKLEPWASFIEWRTKSIPLMGAQVPPARLDDANAILEDEHEKTIEACARTAAVGFLVSHSPGVTAWLRSSAGLTVSDPTTRPTFDLPSLNEGLEAALKQYPTARGAPFAGTHPINAVFHSLTQSLQSSNCVKEFPTLHVRFSTGQGNWARVPWIAILDDRKTTTIQSGVYCVFLFREDGSGVYLTLAQGVTEPLRRLGAVEGKAELRANARTIRTSIGPLRDAGFSLTDDIDLHTGPGLGSNYEVSTIAYKLYERDNVPQDDQLLSDLGALIKSYETMVSEETVTAEADVTPFELLQAFSNSLKTAGLDYGARHDLICGTFMASILSKPFVLLTGLTGSGKTQIALKFGEWLGEARRLVVAVRPDWTGPESLFGYENALSVPDADGRLAWFVPPALEFMLRAVHHQDEPHLLVLDEMNLAHVERYFADFLSGMESGEPTLPNLIKEGAHWRVNSLDPEPVPIPRNLWVVGTVNVDETTYAFSPKVLDRAQTIEFRVATEDLNPEAARPTVAAAAPAEFLASMLHISRDPEWQVSHHASDRSLLVDSLKALHKLLGEHDLEFGHRTLTEAIRFSSTYYALSGSGWQQALDLIVLQMILPRIHGSRPRVEPVLMALETYCTTTEATDAVMPSTPELPFSLSKVRRMLRIVRANQFVSFTE
jgi:5-methylcytosine-specific restriction protein B